MGGLRGIPESVEGFDVEAVDFRLTSSSDGSEPTEQRQTGGLNSTVDVDETVFGVDRRLALGVAAVAIVAVAWRWS